MATNKPSAGMKITKKDGVTFESNIDHVMWTMEELIHAANKDVAKYIRKMIGNKLVALYQDKYVKGAKIRQRKGELKKKYPRGAAQYWARRQQLDLLIGFQNLKKGQKPLWYGQFQELGDYGHPKLGLLRNTVFENIPMINRIQAQYLTALNDKNPTIPNNGPDESGEGET